MQTIYVRDEETQFDVVCDECITAQSTLYAPRATRTSSARFAGASTSAFAAADADIASAFAAFA